MFPAFRLVFDCDWLAVWEGSLTPVCQTYLVRIVYVRRRFFPTFHLDNSYEEVTILEPKIGRDPRGTGEPPEHVYRLDIPPIAPPMCP